MDVNVSGGVELPKPFAASAGNKGTNPSELFPMSRAA
jgi:organic hydroperoxide reductase OsmC/OhrA